MLCTKIKSTSSKSRPKIIQDLASLEIYKKIDNQTEEDRNDPKTLNAYLKLDFLT